MPSKNTPKYEVDILSEAPDVFSGFCPIEPVPKGRPRFRRMGKFVQTYTPKETEQYESAVRKWMTSEYGDLRLPMDGNIVARYEFILPRPKSKPKKIWWSNTKPDIDNFVKSFQDGLDFKRKDHDVELGVIANDSRVSAISATKRYAMDGERPGTKFEFRRIDDRVVIVSPMLTDENLALLDANILRIPAGDIEKYAIYGKEISLVYIALGRESKEAADAIVSAVKKNFPSTRKIIICKF